MEHATEEMVVKGRKSFGSLSSGHLCKTRSSGGPTSIDSGIVGEPETTGRPQEMTNRNS